MRTKLRDLYMSPSFQGLVLRDSESSSESHHAGVFAFHHKMDRRVFVSCYACLGHKGFHLHCYRWGIQP